MIYHIYDEITKREYYVNCTEMQLNRIGIHEWEGRYRSSLYDDKRKLVSVNGRRVMSFAKFVSAIS